MSDNATFNNQGGTNLMPDIEDFETTIMPDSANFTNQSGADHMPLMEGFETTTIRKCGAVPCSVVLGIFGCVGIIVLIFAVIALDHMWLRRRRQRRLAAQARTWPGHNNNNNFELRQMDSAMSSQLESEGAWHSARSSARQSQQQYRSEYPAPLDTTGKKGWDGSMGKIVGPEFGQRCGVNSDDVER